MFIRVCVCMLYGSVYFFALNVPTLQRLALSGLRAFSFFIADIEQMQEPIRIFVSGPTVHFMATFIVWHPLHQQVVLQNKRSARLHEQPGMEAYC